LKAEASITVRMATSLSSGENTMNPVITPSGRFDARLEMIPVTWGENPIWRPKSRSPSIIGSLVRTTIMRPRTRAKALKATPSGLNKIIKTPKARTAPTRYLLTFIPDASTMPPGSRGARSLGYHRTG